METADGVSLLDDLQQYLVGAQQHGRRLSYAPSTYSLEDTRISSTAEMKVLQWIDNWRQAAPETHKSKTPQQKMWQKVRPQSSVAYRIHRLLLGYEEMTKIFESFFRFDVA